MPAVKLQVLGIAEWKSQSKCAFGPMTTVDDLITTLERVGLRAVAARDGVTIMLDRYSPVTVTTKGLKSLAKLLRRIEKERFTGVGSSMPLRKFAAWRIEAKFAPPKEIVSSPEVKIASAEGRENVGGGSVFQGGLPTLGKR